MNSNNSNTSKGCLSWFKGIGGALLGLLTAAASCAGIMQYMESNGAGQAPAWNPAAILVVTSEPASNSSNASNADANIRSVSAEDRQAVEEFLRNAVATEIRAYQYSDASYATLYYGDALQAIQSQIVDLNAKGVYLDARFDFDNSYVYDIRVPQNNRIEVDSCEYWENKYYDRLTGSLISADTWKLVPQTILIELVDNNYYITSVAFYTGQAFCS